MIIALSLYEKFAIEILWLRIEPREVYLRGNYVRCVLITW